MKIALPVGWLDNYPWAHEIAVLIDPMTELVGSMWALGYETAGKQYLDDGFAVPFGKAAEWARQHAGELVSGIDSTTKDQLAELLAGLEDGTSDEDIAAAISSMFDDFGSRADTIARTETGWAANLGNASAWGDAGYGYVEISDGTDSDQECADADGQIWSLDDFEANPLEHPNCGRSADPVETADVDPSDVDESD